MARRRDYADEYRRRQERARAEGFASDYDRRMRRGDPGRQAPRDIEDRELLRGHRGQDYLLGHAEPGDLLYVMPDERDARGRFTTLMLVPEGFGTERLISLRGLDSDELADLLYDLIDAGVAIDVGYLEKLVGG